MGGGGKEMGVATGPNNSINVGYVKQSRNNVFVLEDILNAAHHSRARETILITRGHPL